MQGNPGAGLATPVKQAYLGKRAKRPVHGDTGAAQFDGKVGLIRDRLAGLPLPRVDTALHLGHHIAPVCSCGIVHHHRPTGSQIMT